MELLAAVIGARATHFINTSIDIKINRTILWTDSQCLIHWYYSKKLLPKFVANRIKDIKKYNLDEIRYISTNENPADLLTRSNFESLVPETWLYGPSRLSSEHDWPKNNFQTLEPIEETSSQPTLISVEVPVLNPTSPYNLKM